MDVNDLAAIWSALDLRRKAVVIAATLGVFAAVLALARIAATPQLALLYSGLDATQSGEVIEALEGQGVPYEIRGEAIFVPEMERDALRMRLATRGIPMAGGAGYEILDGLSGFGTTSQMFDAAYWRAKEGELARTILSSPDVRQVRVHIGNPVGGSFRRDADTTASVMLTARSGAVSSAVADALRFLVASAVQGLNPDRVTVIDAESGRVIGGRGDDHSAASAIAQEKALKQSVERLLDARLGLGNAIVELSVEPVTETERIIERRIDPQSRVAVSTDVQEKVSSEKNGGGDAVTVASNLPNGDAGEAAQGSQSQNSESRTVTNFEISEVTRDLERGPGAVKRMTVAVLLNRDALVSGNKADLSAEELEEVVRKEIEDIRDLVSASVGLDDARGDRVSVKAMPFGPNADVGVMAQEAPWFAALVADPVKLTQFAALALVVLALGLFVVRPVLTASQEQVVPDGVSGEAGVPALAEADIGVQRLEAGTPQDIRAVSNPLQESADRSGPADLPTVYSAEMEQPAGSRGDRLGHMVSSLRHMVEERQMDTVEILRNWIEDEKSGDAV